MRIVSGHPTPEEVAALVVVLSLLQQARSGTSPNHRSSDAWRRAVPEVKARHWRDWPYGWRDVTSRTGRPVTRSDRTWTRLVG